MVSVEMFCHNDSASDLASIDTLSSADVLAAARSLQRRERQLLARTVFLADRMAAVIVDDLLAADRLTHRHINDIGDKVVVGEVAVRLNISRYRARTWLTLASALRGFPKVLDAFLRGTYSLERTSIIIGELGVLSDNTAEGMRIRDEAERVALQLADADSHDLVLRDRIAEMVIALDPEGAAAGRREHARRRQHVTVKSDINGHASITASVSAEFLIRQ